MAMRQQQQRLVALLLLLLLGQALLSAAARETAAAGRGNAARVLQAQAAPDVRPTTGNRTLLLLCIKAAGVNDADGQCFADPAVRAAAAAADDVTHKHPARHE